jgi:hypothetical protein
VKRQQNIKKGNYGMRRKKEGERKANKDFRKRKGGSRI